MISAASRRPRSSGNNNMNHIFRYSFLFFFLVQAFVSKAQVDSTAKPVVVQADTAGRHPGDSLARHPLAIFLPLFLDSAFDASGNYRYDKNFPKFINPGLEFYEGAQLALDSLKKEITGLNGLDVQIYDSRSASQPLQQVLASPAFQRTGLILGQVT